MGIGTQWWAAIDLPMIICFWAVGNKPQKVKSRVRGHYYPLFKVMCLVSGAWESPSAGSRTAPPQGKALGLLAVKKTKTKKQLLTAPFSLTSPVGTGVLATTPPCAPRWVRKKRQEAPSGQGTGNAIYLEVFFFFFLKR